MTASSHAHLFWPLLATGFSRIRPIGSEKPTTNLLLSGRVRVSTLGMSRSLTPSGSLSAGCGKLWSRLFRMTWRVSESKGNGQRRETTKTFFYTTTLSLDFQSLARMPIATISMLQPRRLQMQPSRPCKFLTPSFSTSWGITEVVRSASSTS